MFFVFFEDAFGTVLNHLTPPFLPKLFIRWREEEEGV